MGVQGISNSAKGYGVNGKSANGTGGKFYGGQFGVYAEGSTYGLYAFGATGQGIIGESAASGGYGGYFDDNHGCGVYGSSTTEYGGVFWGGVAGVFACGTVAGSYGIDAASYGDANSVAVNGDSRAYGYGVRGTSFYGYGIYGSSTYGVAGGFNGNVTVTGTLSAGAKYFKIDHPLDPANKYLVHSCIESDQMINLYRGNVVLDANGQAIVTVPDWFEALNKNLSYQLTCVGGFAPVYVASELHKGAFAIAGGKPGLKVCWQITGERQDAYAKAHPLEVEQDKPQDKKGKFLHPKEWGMSESLGENYEAEQRIHARQHAQAK